MLAAAAQDGERIRGRNPAGGGLEVSLAVDGTIASVCEVSVRECGNAWLSPGLVDLQVNGYRGDDFNGDLDTGTVSRLVRNLLQTGTTTFLPTLITDKREKLLRNLAVIAEARLTDPLAAAAIPGVHMEGPWLSPEDGYRGAHCRDHIRPPSFAEFEEWNAASNGLVRLITLSPHWPEAPAMIRALTAAGVVVSIGHTHASPRQIHAAAEAGATCSTHLGNGLPLQLARHPNPIWSQLADDRLTSMFIADGHHLSPDTLRAMSRSKGLSRSALVSDLVALAGMPPGSYSTTVGGAVDLHADGRLNLHGTSLLAGATATLAENVARFASITGASLAEVLTLATINPVRLLSLRLGLQPGAPGNLLKFHHLPGDATLSIEQVWLSGRPSG